ncbi:hypothetical protein B0H14DRAFT_2596840 [Mycena olivaceomarginata]|nr:hypothetical protein B0H14DRAFT_2596840 [Mycena olivaceomarginata]
MLTPTLHCAARPLLPPRPLLCARRTRCWRKYFLLSSLRNGPAPRTLSEPCPGPKHPTRSSEWTRAGPWRRMLVKLPPAQTLILEETYFGQSGKCAPTSGAIVRWGALSACTGPATKFSSRANPALPSRSLTPRDVTRNARADWATFTVMDSEKTPATRSFFGDWVLPDLD